MTRKNSINDFSVSVFTFAVLRKDGDPNGVTELESTEKVRYFSGAIKAKLN